MRAGGPATRFPARDRLRRPADFDRVMRAGRRVTDSEFSLRWLARAAPGQRLGIIVPRNAGSAVLRNRTRRIIRELFRLNRWQFPEQADMVIVVRRGPTPEALQSQAIRQAITALAGRARAAQGKSGAAS